MGLVVGYAVGTGVGYAVGCAVGEDEAAWSRGGPFKGRLEDAGRVVRAFRAAISSGYEPSSLDVDMALECMRLRTLRRFTDAEYEGVPKAPISSPGGEFSVLGSPTPGMPAPGCAPAAEKYKFGICGSRL